LKNHNNLIYNLDRETKIFKKLMHLLRQH